MAVNSQLQTGSYTRKLAVLHTQSVIEIKFANTEAIEVAAVYPQISLTTCEASSGRVNYGGRLIATLVYSDGENKLCRVQKGAEFTHYADDERLTPAQNVECRLSCERYQVKREGSTVIVAVVAGAEITVFEEAARSYLTSADGAICKNETKKLYSLVNFSGESEVEDEFECVATDVLIPAAQALVLDCSVKAGVVETSGEIYLSLLAVRDGMPVGLDRVIPFRCETECDQALLSRRAYCRAEIKNVSVNCKVNEEKNQCSVELNATLGLYGHFYEEEEISLLDDAFSPECELNLSTAEEVCETDDDVKVYSERVSGACAVKAKLDYTCAFLAASLPRAEFERTADGLEGAVTATLLYEQGGEVHSTEVNMPFTLSLPGLSANCKNISVAVLSASLRQRAEGECEGEATLKIAAFDGTQCKCTYVTEITEGDKKQVNDCAISVYIPTAGDGLWETAKKLSSSPESIQSSNPDLTFPLTGKERILVYRAKQG